MGSQFASDLNDIKLISVLGQGAGGVVFRGRWATREVAVKVRRKTIVVLSSGGLSVGGGAGGVVRGGASMHPPRPRPSREAPLSRDAQRTTSSLA
jgi:hypothetical protein